MIGQRDPWRHVPPAHRPERRAIDVARVRILPRASRPQAGERGDLGGCPDIKTLPGLAAPAVGSGDVMLSKGYSTYHDQNVKTAFRSPHRAWASQYTDLTSLPERKLRLYCEL